MEVSGLIKHMAERVNRYPVLGQFVRHSLEIVDKIDFTERCRAVGRHSLALLERFDSDPEARMIEKYGLDADVKRGDSPATTWRNVREARGDWCPSKDASPAKDARYMRQLFFDGDTKLGPRDRVMLFLDQHTKQK